MREPARAPAPLPELGLRTWVRTVYVRDTAAIEVHGYGFRTDAFEAAQRFHPGAGAQVFLHGPVLLVCTSQTAGRGTLVEFGRQLGRTWFADGR
jgi:hypothetical protein